MASIRIGISGWRYEPWRKIFYPADLAQHRELEFASRAFASIEINGSFYSLQTPQSYESWYRATPADFVFSVVLNSARTSASGFGFFGMWLTKNKTTSSRF